MRDGLGGCFMDGVCVVLFVGLLLLCYIFRFAYVRVGLFDWLVFKDFGGCLQFAYALGCFECLRFIGMV